MPLRRMRRERRRPIRGLSVNRMLPNVLTILALCAGLTAVRFGIQGRWEAAVVAIMVAAVLDALDGRIARLLNGQSKFGAELDSLSDVISFGVAPAVLLYLWIMVEAGSFGWIAALAFAVCAALRLARFNSKLDASDLPPYAFNYFTGVPAPAGAGLALLPMVVTFQTGPTVLGHPVVVGIWAVLIALLMVSRWPTFSFKGVRVPQRYVVPVLATVGLLAAMLATMPWLTLALIAVAYLASLPFSLQQFRRLQREAARLEEESAARAEPPASPGSGSAGT